MRRIFLAIFCCLLLATTVSAASKADDVQSSTLVSDTGSCEVTLTLTLSLDEAPGRLVFPLPGNARDITVNGTASAAPVSDGLRQVDLTGAVSTAGVHTVVIHYDLPDTVQEEIGQLVMTLELLSGFSLPVERMRFTVTMPGAPEKKASFVSTYLQESVESVMDYQVSGATISGQTIRSLKDSETLSMTLVVSEEMFPRSLVEMIDYGWATMAMMICGG